jgi:hypothetical protein
MHALHQLVPNAFLVHEEITNGEFLSCNDPNRRSERFMILRVIYLGGAIAVEKCRDRQRDQAPL